MRALGLVLVTLLVVLASGAGTPAADPSGTPGEPTTHELAHEGAVAILAGNFPRATQSFDQAAAIDPDFTRAHLGMAIAALGSGDRRKFNESLRRVDSMTHGAPEVRYVLAVQKWQSGDLRVAEDEARGAARADTAFLEARYLLGMIEAARGNLPHAAATLNDALHVDPTWAPVHLQLGAVLAASGDLDGALAEMRLALSIDPDLEPAGREPGVTFAGRRVLPGNTHVSGLGLPLPVPEPAFLAAESRPPLLAAAGSAAIPEWFLDYAMAGFHADNGAWGPAAKLFERALTLNDRETIRIPVGGRLVDYLPHRRLARVCFETGDLREAGLHLEIARNQAATSADSLRLLETLMGIAASRTRLVLQPLPDHTADEAVAIRGLLLTRNRPAWVDIGGQKALLRPATAEDLRSFPEGSSVTDAESGMQPLYFEVPSYPLPSVGPHRIRIRPGTAETAAAEVEVLIMRDGPPIPGDAHPAPGDRLSAADGGGG